MIRTQIQFDEQQYERIRSLAHRKRISISEAVRRLVGNGLRGGLADERQEPVPAARALLGIAGIGRSGVHDLGRRHDEYLAEESDE